MGIKLLSRLMLAGAAQRGDPDDFRKTLLQVLRHGPLDADAQQWLADFLESGGNDDLKFIVTRTKAGRPRRQLPSWYPSRYRRDGRYIGFRMIADESSSKEEAFDRAKIELKVGKKIAEEFWKLRKSDEVQEAEDPFRAETYLEIKRLTLLERAERGK